MEIASIKGDTILLIYHPAEGAADVGQQFAVLELPDKTEGLIAQVISNDSLEYAGIQQEMIQNILEQRISQSQLVLNQEQGMGEIRSLKLATAKIRKRVSQGSWHPWGGWIPTRNVEIERVDANGLLQNVIPDPRHGLSSFASFDGTPVEFDGPRFNMVSVITGVKGSGKSHLAKHLVLAFSDKDVPCIIFDINGEYVELPGAQVLRWGENFMPELAEVGHQMLSLVVRAVYPLPETSERVFEGVLPVQFGRRRAFCEERNEAFTIGVDFLRQQNWSNNDYIQQAIDDRLRVIGNMNLFSTGQAPPQGSTNFAAMYDQACTGEPIVFDMRSLNPTLQHALVRAINRQLEERCDEESNGEGRYPFVFYEEAHFYIKTDAILSIITRGRHIGMAPIFVTNTPQNLPDAVFRQMDNLFLLNLSHKDDIRSVGKNSFTDEDTIESFATRMPEHHALIMGNVTDRYPVMVRVDPLPPEIPPTGMTRSTWDRLAE